MFRHLSVLLCSLALACGPGEDTPEPGSEVPPAAVETAPTPGADGADAGASGGPRVVFLGTSLTAGLGLAGPEEAYVARVAEVADSAGTPIRAVNAGVSGETSAGGLRRLDWVLREPLDVLVLELGANDGLRGQDPAALARNLGTIIERTRARYPGTPVVLAGMEAPPNLGPAYTEAFRAVFSSVAADHDAILVPFLLEGVAGDPALNQDDAIHPTPEGHRIMAHTLWPYLRTALAQAGASAGAGGP